MKLFLLLACAAAPVDPKPEPTAPAASGRARAADAAAPERDVPFAGTGRWDLDGYAVTLAQGTIAADGAPVLLHVYDAPVLGARPDGAAVLYAPADPGEGDGGLYAVYVADGMVVATPLLTEGRPDRLALAPDGGTLVYVAGTSGITSLWALPVAGGPPRQLTNVGLQKTPGQAPVGFVPPPERGPVRFDGERVVWTADGVERAVAWR